MSNCLFVNNYQEHDKIVDEESLAFFIFFQFKPDFAYKSVAY